jgi:hypothetical protein
MVNMILGYFTMSLALIILIITIVETGVITNFSTPVFASATVTEVSVHQENYIMRNNHEKI